jgi:hypothetical protein
VSIEIGGRGNGLVLSRPAEIGSVQRIVREHERLIVEKWHEYFDA